MLSYGETCRVFTGIASVPTVNTAGDSAYCFTYGTGGRADIVFLRGAVSESGKAGIYVLDVSPTVTMEDGRLVYRYSVLLDGAVTELEVTGAAKTGAFSRTGLVASVSLGLDGAWEIDAPIAPAVADAAILCEGGVIQGPVMGTAACSTAWSTECLSVDGSTKLYLVDGQSVTQAGLDDVIALASFPSASSKILIVRSSLQADSPDYYVAGSIYIVK